MKSAEPGASDDDRRTNASRSPFWRTATLPFRAGTASSALLMSPIRSPIVRPARLSVGVAATYTGTGSPASTATANVSGSLITPSRSSSNAIGWRPTAARPANARSGFQISLPEASRAPKSRRTWASNVK